MSWQETETRLKLWSSNFYEKMAWQEEEERPLAQRKAEDGFNEWILAHGVICGYNIESANTWVKNYFMFISSAS